jgi:hypothetical protein
MTHKLEPRRGFDWSHVTWGKPNSRPIILFAPSMAGGTPPANWLRPDGWIEVPYDAPNVKVEPQHSMRDTVKALSNNA